MEQPPPPRSTPTPPPSSAPRPPAESGPVRPGGATLPPSPPAPSGPSTGLVCPVCSEPRQEDARFCEECGHDFGTDAPPAAPPPAAERPRLSGPILWIVLLIWAVLAVAGLWFLYTALYSL